MTSTNYETAIHPSEAASPLVGHLVGLAAQLYGLHEQLLAVADNEQYSQAADDDQVHALRQVAQNVRTAGTDVDLLTIGLNRAARQAAGLPVDVDRQPEWPGTDEYTVTHTKEPR
jgi:hypothetical protein